VLMRRDRGEWLLMLRLDDTMRFIKELHDIQDREQPVADPEQR
jgi:hypothetical protein